MSAQTDEIVEQDEPGRGEPTEGLAALRTYIRATPPASWAASLAPFPRWSG